MPVTCHFSRLSAVFNATTLFSDISGTLFTQPQGLVGPNGQGKSVLFSLLAQRQKPAEGYVRWARPFYYLPQRGPAPAATLADVLGISDILNAQQRLEAGDTAPELFELVADSWEQSARAQHILSDAGLGHLALKSDCRSFSGGEQARLALCLAFMQRDTFLLLDEPDSHLDSAGRRWLGKHLREHRAGSLVISHDRTLLGQMNTIFELTAHGLNEYGGNYEVYATEQMRKQQALLAHEARLTSQLRQEKLEQQKREVKRTKRQQQGEKLRRDGSQATILLDGKKEWAEGRMAGVMQRNARVINQLSAERRDVSEQRQIKDAQTLKMPVVAPSGRLMVHVNRLQLPRGNRQAQSFDIHGGEHWHIAGRNGCGKSTLLRVLMGEVLPAAGEFSLHGRVCYLDQKLQLLDPTLSATEALCRYAPAVSAQTWRTHLGALRIRGERGLLPLGSLSGGERLKVTLLALTLAEPLPDILILDEPDNALDLDSKQLLEQALRDYRGTLLLVSHDEELVARCGITHTLRLE
ncbi:ABC-F family ATP-binding cassette domain-containing protein [Enterobacteriaceae bacterium 4M9]|nr:ABC-F family ATP-binding cassette domain-containing protein [Enterobacteriaceae bacterium 4M9]